jgi:hypothetical protein
MQAGSSRPPGGPTRIVDRDSTGTTRGKEAFKVSGEKSFRELRRESIGSQATLDVLRFNERLAPKEGVKPAGKIRFKIKHLMYLTLWTALILAVRDPLIATLPQLVRMIFWMSAAAAAAIVAGLYAIALLMGESRHKDLIVNRLCYVLIADGILFFILSLAKQHTLDG